MISKQHLLFGGASVLLLGGSIGASYALLSSHAPEQRSVAVEARHLREVVTASGDIQPAQNADLSFERSGRIARVYKNVGDSVHAGDLLMELDNGTEGTLVAQARALLEQKQAGASSAEIGIYQAAADAAKADLDKTKSDAQASVLTAQSAIETAQNNLKLAAGGNQSEIVGQAYESAAATLQAAVPSLDAGLNQADAVLGIDHISSLATFRLSALDPSKLMIATNQYADLKPRIQSIRNAATTLPPSAPHETIDALLANEQSTLLSLQQLLSSVSDVLKATPTGGSADQATLAGLQTAIQQTRALLSTQMSHLIATKQALENAKNSLNAYTIAYNKAQQDLVNTQASTAGLVRLKEAAYQQALANLTSKTQPVRETDLAPLRASLAAASVAYSRTILRSPIDGIVSKQDGKTGVIVNPYLPVVSVMSANAFQLEAFVAETDLSNIAVGNTVDITTDAYGSSIVFPGTVTHIDPAPSTVKGVSGYKTTIQFSHPDDRIKAGMTGNATIIHQEKDVPLALPSGSILQKNGTFEVLLQDASGASHEQPVTIGVHGADGWWELLSGVRVGDRVEDLAR